MTRFSDQELAYLREERRLARIATVGADGTPHVTPVGWSLGPSADSIDVGGRNFEKSKKYRDVARSGRATIVIDDLASTDPWRPTRHRSPRSRRDRGRSLADDSHPRRSSDLVGHFLTAEVAGIATLASGRNSAMSARRQERNQRVDVVLLERSDIAGDERIVLGTHRGSA